MEATKKQSLVAGFNTLVTALQKAQQHGAFTLQEAGEILTSIQRLRPMFEALDREASEEDVRGSDLV